MNPRENYGKICIHENNHARIHILFAPEILETCT